MKRIGVDLFSGAGGLSLGAEAAGIHLELAVEHDMDAAATFKRNHSNTVVVTRDITEVNPKEYLKQNPFIIFGGPPCQGFSMSNLKTRTTSNKNNSLYNEFLRFIKILRPDWVLFENVEGIMSFNKGYTVKTIIHQFEKYGYKVKSDVLHASEYGVPQERSRFILIANKVGIDFKFPDKSCNKINVREAISDLPSLSNGEKSSELPYKDIQLSDYARKIRNGSYSSCQNLVSKNEDYVIERYKYIGPGENWSAIPNELMQNYKNKKNCHSGIYKRLDPEKPSVVISNYRKNMLIHPYEDRGLSVREAARLQSFPDSFIFEGSLMNIQQQIGNAVPPLLAEKIFKGIMSHY